MMRDDIRMGAYRRAIGKVCPGKTVCEIGVGLGPLSLMALEAGAERVYGIEVNPDILALAQRTIANNGYDSDRFIAMPGISLNVSLPERLDVILSETLDSVAFGENTLIFMIDALNRSLKPDGVFIPRSIESEVALATPIEFERQHSFWTDALLDRYGFDYTEVCRELVRYNQTLSVSEDELFSDWTHWRSVEFSDSLTYADVPPVALRVLRRGSLRGFCVSFDVLLAEGIHLRTSPSEPETSWKQGFSPFPSAVECDRDDSILLDIDVPTDDCTWVPVRSRFVHSRSAGTARASPNVPSRGTQWGQRPAGDLR